MPLPPAGFAQEPAAPPAPAAAGSWEGWAKLTNDWAGQVCRYDGGPGAPSVRLELTVVEGQLRGSVAIDLPAEPGSGCPPLRKRYGIAEATQGAGTVSFTDAGGNEWTLALRQNNSVLQGLLAWRPGGREEPLAEGFTRPDGLRPTTRLNGEVRLQRSGDEASSEEPAAGGAHRGGGGCRGAGPARRASAGTSATWVSSSAPTSSRSACSTGRTSSARAARTPGP